MDWRNYAKHFKIDYRLLSDEALKLMEKVSIISEQYYKREPFPTWWELSDILHNCCEFCPEDIRSVMVDIHENIVNGIKSDCCYISCIYSYQLHLNLHF